MYEIQSIVIDFDNIKNIDISDNSKVRTIALETTDFSLLYEIQSIEFLDDKILVYNRDNVVAFGKNGKFLFNVGQKGQGPGEYQNISCFFVKEKNICLFDIATQKILTYNAGGQFLYSKSIQQKEGISIIYPIDNQKYISINRYKGGNTNTPSISFLNSRYEKIQDIDNAYLGSNDFDQNSFYSFQGEVLYWKFLNDTIFSIVRQKKVIPKYLVDFQKYAIPQPIRRTNDTEGLIEYINSTENPNLATLIRYIQEDSLYIRFSFIQKEALINYSRFNKITKNVETCHIIDSNHKLSPNYFMLHKDSSIIISASYIDDEESNPSLVFVKENDYFSN
jgi:hypothetical protein